MNFKELTNVSVLAKGNKVSDKRSSYYLIDYYGLYIIRPIVHFVLFYPIAILLQLHPDSDIIYEMRGRQHKPTLLPTQGIFNLRHHIVMV